VSRGGPQKTMAKGLANAPGRSGFRPLTKVLVTVGVAVTVLVLGGQWALHQSFFEVQHVSLSGVRHESTAQVLAASGLNQHPAMINVSATSIEKNLEVFPWIDSVSLSKHWPNSVVVIVHESQAVAVAFGPKHVLDYVDSTGRNLGRAPLKMNLPTLRYVDATKATWPFDGVGRSAAWVASQLPKAFASQVSVITENSHGSVTLTMTTPVSFILGPPTQLRAKFVAVASVIAHSTLGVGDVVNVTVPDELAVTGPAPS
jgi:cell division septal protein FtsQ